VTSMSKAHFKVYTGRGPYVFSTADSECSVVDVGWIENCIESNTLEPVYPYLLLQSASGLTALDSKPNARDIGELIKAIVTCNGHRKRAYATLHEQVGLCDYAGPYNCLILFQLHDQYPHKSGLQWEELHKGHRFQIKRALSMIEIRMKIQTDATLSRHLGSDDPPIITNAKLRAGRDDTSISTLGSSKFIPRKPRAPPSVIVKDMQRSSGVIRTRMSSGVATTEEHVANVAAFLVERKQVDPRAGYPTKKDWVIFKERVIAL
jgi:hypothetical protein